MKNHGMSRTRFYRIWAKMRQRCNDSNCTNYHKYGAKGVKVCERWDDFRNFHSDMFDTYEDGLTLDRIDNSKGYEPSNCRWSTYKEQNRNRTNNHFITYKGKEMTLAEAEEKYDLPKDILLQRLKLGWSIERAIETKSQKRKKAKHETR